MDKYPCEDCGEKPKVVTKSVIEPEKSFEGNTVEKCIARCKCGNDVSREIRTSERTDYAELKVIRVWNNHYGQDPQFNTQPEQHPPWHKETAEGLDDVPDQYKAVVNDNQGLVGYIHENNLDVVLSSPLMLEALREVLSCEMGIDENGDAFLKVPAKSINDLGVITRNLIKNIEGSEIDTTLKFSELEDMPEETRQKVLALIVKAAY